MYAFVPVFISQPSTESHSFKAISPAGYTVEIDIEVPAGGGARFAREQILGVDLSKISPDDQKGSLGWCFFNVTLLNFLLAIAVLILSIILDFAGWEWPLSLATTTRIWLCLFPIWWIFGIAIWRLRKRQNAEGM